MFIKAVVNGLIEYFEFYDENMTDEEILEYFKEEIEMQLAANIKTIDQLKIASEIVVEKVKHPGDEWLQRQLGAINKRIKEDTITRNRYESLLIGRNREPVMHHPV